MSALIGFAIGLFIGGVIGALALTLLVHRQQRDDSRPLTPRRKQ